MLNQRYPIRRYELTAGAGSTVTVTVSKVLFFASSRSCTTDRPEAHPYRVFVASFGRLPLSDDLRSSVELVVLVEHCEFDPSTDVSTTTISGCMPAPLQPAAIRMDCPTAIFAGVALIQPVG